jgi:hypothetical protein
MEISMTNFSTDADLVKWEPTLFRDLASPGQRLACGSDGATAGLTLTSASGYFLDARVAPGHVVRLVAADGVDLGCYEVLSVESQTALLATDVDRCADDSVDLPVGSPWTYTIDTFGAQAGEVRFELLARLGLESDRRGRDEEAWILDRRVLRRASVFATLAMIFEGQSGGNQEGLTLSAKAALYRGLYEKELAKIRVRLDRNGDGLADDMRAPGSARLSRD